MKHLFNVIRFLVYLPLSILLLYAVYNGIYLSLYYLGGLSVGWLIILLLFFGSLIIGLLPLILGAISMYLSLLNPYKRLGRWILIPIAILYGIFNIYLVWHVVDLSATKGFICAVFGTAMIIYCSQSYSVLISKNIEDDEY